MLGQALALILLLVVKSHQGQGFAEHVVGISGDSVWLRPPSIQTKLYSVKWKMQPHSSSSFFRILLWKNGSAPSYVEESSNLTLNHLKDRLTFTTEDLTLLIKAAQPWDSGLYCLEITNDSGKIWKFEFQVSVFDHVEKPHLQEQWKTLDRGVCQVTLSCSVSRGDNISYAWYKGGELIQTPRNLTKLEEQIDDNGLHIYTCNVSNPVSWANHTLHLTQGCLKAYQNIIFLSILVSTGTLLMALFLGTLTCFCVRRRKRKQSQTSPEEFLTIYEDVNNGQARRIQEQNSPGEGTTIYSMIQLQSSVPTSRETANTLYSFVQSSGKAGSTKKNHNPSFSKTIYQEVRSRNSFWMRLDREHPNLKTLFD
ncbi:natural killer cell receptor 2B4 isoform X2 [Phacochoerus africanus]|uniref:natural killer cell receptor 2B4 isoform X2 n=1 Tax=Phacochoerus africanus TaxID=41426 RepID=UPI001FDA8815|nr:natural killer cell receptor 2B4 isoform X2 [Phacochoerus africanus]